jgi:hypothetical protein
MGESQVNLVSGGLSSEGNRQGLGGVNTSTIYADFVK